MLSGFQIARTASNGGARRLQEMNLRQETLRPSIVPLAEPSYMIRKARSDPVVGSGFAGSLMAMIARRLGFSTALIERGRHPVLAS